MLPGDNGLAIVRRMRVEGIVTAVLLISEDLDELMELADRIVVMSAGRIVHESARAEADPVRIGRYMAGHAA